MSLGKVKDRSLDIREYCCWIFGLNCYCSILGFVICFLEITPSRWAPSCEKVKFSEFEISI